MRTTLVLDDALVRRAKQRAIERDMTLSEIVNDALRATLREAPAESPPFTLLAYGRPGRATHHEPGDFVTALEDEDRDGLR